METVDLIIRSSTTFYETLKSDEHGRYRSWEHCYKQFYYARHDPNADVDYLSLHLAFYLASWGMYRGSSFLLQKDYRIHIPIVEEILSEKYDPLFGIECVMYRYESIQKLLKDLVLSMNEHYNKARMTVLESEVTSDTSETLITKILMGTLGCVPAYDRYFKLGVRNHHVTTGTFNINSILIIADFYEKNRIVLEQTRKEMKVEDLPYPQMKMLDMGFWQIGFDLDTNKGVQVPH